MRKKYCGKPMILSTKASVLKRNLKRLWWIKCNSVTYELLSFSSSSFHIMVILKTFNICDEPRHTNTNNYRLVVCTFFIIRSQNVFINLSDLLSLVLLYEFLKSNNPKSDGEVEFGGISLCNIITYTVIFLVIIFCITALRNK